MPTPDPHRLDLYEILEAALSAVRAVDEVCVPPGAPAERLAGAPDLAARTRRRAPDDRLRDGGKGADERSAVEAFLADEERIERLRDQARQEAECHAEECRFAEVVKGEC